MTIDPSITHAAKPDDFFVGYLPPPSRLARFIRRTAEAIVAVVVVAAVALAATQEPPGDGRFDFTRLIELRGEVLGSPAPFLVTTHPDGAPRTLLLVAAGKHGFDTTGLAGRTAALSGALITRHGVELFEVFDSAVADPPRTTPPDALPAAREWPPAVAESPAGRMTLRGEIVDPKCHLGAMKPGQGKVHRACAARCIAGGIPPLLRAQNADGRLSYYLLVSADHAAGPVSDAVLPFVGEHVEVEGQAAILQGTPMRTLRVDPASIRRIQ